MCYDYVTLKWIKSCTLLVLNPNSQSYAYYFSYHSIPSSDLGFLHDYESDYSHIYGRLPIPTRGFRQYPPPRGQIYVSEWE